MLNQFFPHGPLDRIVSDKWELPEYIKIKTNCSFVLDIIDYFTKYLLSYPLIKKDSDSILLCIKEFTFSIGMPNILQTDNCLEFVNAKIKE